MLNSTFLDIEPWKGNNLVKIDLIFGDCCQCSCLMLFMSRRTIIEPTYAFVVNMLLRLVVSCFTSYLCSFLADKKSCCGPMSG